MYAYNYNVYAFDDILTCMLLNIQALPSGVDNNYCNEASQEFDTIIVAKGKISGLSHPRQ